MKINRIGYGSVTKEIYDNGTILYISYKTPVGIVPSYGEWKGKLILTDRYYSRTTSKQISTKIIPDYNRNYGEEIITMSHNTFLSILEVLSNKKEVTGAGRGWNDRVSANITEYDSWNNVEPVKKELFNDVERRMKRKNPMSDDYRRSIQKEAYNLRLKLKYIKGKSFADNLKKERIYNRINEIENALKTNIHPYEHIKGHKELFKSQYKKSNPAIYQFFINDKNEIFKALVYGEKVNVSKAYINLKNELIELIGDDFWSDGNFNLEFSYDKGVYIEYSNSYDYTEEVLIIKNYLDKYVSVIKK